MRKRLSLLLVLTLLISLFLVPATVEGQEAIKVTVDGKLIEFDVPPTIVEGRTLVPLRGIFEALGVVPQWNGETRTVTATKGTTTIILPIGSKYATVSGKQIELDVPAQLIENRTMVPARFIAESLGANVGWDNDTRTVIITRAVEIAVHFIDVGQADAILIKTPDGAMLIDAGNNADADLVTSYIKEQGIEKLDVVVGTHPHEDHIGGLDAVIETFDIGKVYMPKVAHTTKTFEDVLLAIQNKGLKVTDPTPGATFEIGEAKCTILAPNSSSYKDLNNYSIVIKMEYGQTSFLFTGDAEDVSEKEMLDKKYDLSADVLKGGHHGSESSTTQAFLDAVNPKYAVVMVGTGNDYGHPHKTVMDRLKAKGVIVYRTDENGTIVATSDGVSISFSTKPGTYSGSSSGGGSTGSTGSTVPTAPVPTDTDNDRTVYWTPGGKSYHYTRDCPTLARSKTIHSGPLSQCPKSDPCDKCVR